MLDRANKEGWKAMRNQATIKSITQAERKTAAAAANNATIAADLKRRMLLRLKRIEEKYPYDATEVRTQNGNTTVIFRLRDLTAMYKDLVSDMPAIADNSVINQNMLTYADIFSRPAPNRSIEEIEEEE